MVTFRFSSKCTVPNARCLVPECDGVYGSVTDSCAMTSVTERPSCRSRETGETLLGTPSTNHIDINRLRSRAAQPAGLVPYDSRQTWCGSSANDTYQHNNLLRF